MAIYLKKFENHTQYENYINGSGAILPNVSICTTEGDVHYNPYVEPVETRVIAKYNITDTSEKTEILHDVYNISAIEIDGVEQSELDSNYQFDTYGEHTVKYTLTDPTFIEDQTFGSCSSLTSVNIPNSITSIGYGAFDNCTSLTSCTMGSGVTSIDNNAFDNCTSLTSIDIPSSVTSIGNGAFYYCTSLTSIDIPSGVTSIGYGAFCGCDGLDEASRSAILAINPNAFYCD